MPNGKVHDSFWKKAYPLPIIITVIVYILVDFTLGYIAPYTCAKSWCLSNSLLTSIGIPFGYLLGKVITPDLDMPGITQSEWWVMRKFKIFGALFTAYWMPYGYLFSHRSFWTHSYFISSFIRVIYQFWWIFVINLGNFRYFILFGIYLGLCISDSIHIWLDYHYQK